MKLEGKVAIVTGGGKGIGRGIALRLAKEGANVVIVEIDLAAGKKVVQEIEQLGCKSSIAIETDVGKVVDVNRMVKATVEKFRTVDILVNNAGVAWYKRFLDVTEEIFDRTMEVDVKAIFFCSQSVARVMVGQKKRGKIINITSISGQVASKELSYYCAAKGGANMLTKALAFELSEYGINVNAVGPGVVETDLNRKVVAQPDIYKHIVGETPLGRYGTPDDMAGAVVYLASDDADYVTGHILYVDGGCLCRACY